MGRLDDLIARSGAADKKQAPASALPTPSVKASKKEDTSPLIIELTLKHNGAHTDITATIPSPQGHQVKRIVIPGEVTADRLAAILGGVENW